MHPRSEPFIELIWFQILVGALAIITAIVLMYFMWSPNPEERCAIAQVRIEVYEECIARPGCYKSSKTQAALLRARIEEVKWCEHPLSRGE
jgi:hypothetical protein